MPCMRRSFSPFVGFTLRLGVLLVVCPLGWAFHPGVARWLVKTSLVPTADLESPTNIDLVDLINGEKLPSDPLNDVTKNDARYRAVRMPPFENALGVTDGDIVRTTGWLHLVAAESDGD